MCARTAAAGERGRPGDGIPLSRLWPKTRRVLEQGISLLREGGSQHRICLDAGFRRRPAKRKSRAEARTHFRTEERRNDEQRYHIQHPDRVQ